MVRGHISELDIRSGDIGDHITRLPASAESDSGHIMVPDTELLLSAKYSKQGADLILTGADGHKVVILGYFNHEKHPDLRAPGGATLSADTVDKLTVSDTPGQYAQVGAPAGAAVIGKVERLGGSATVQHANGTTEELHIGDTLRQGDVVQTGDGSQIGLSLSDGTAFNMGAGARMVLSELIYDATNTSSNAAVFSLVKGSISFVAGKVAKTGDMKVETPVATMGIRGTSVNTNISTDVNGNIVSVTYSLMADPDGHVGSFNILDRTTGAIIGTITTTDTSFVVTPSANLGIIAAQVGKTPEQVAQELAVAQALFPIFLANPTNFDQQNLNVNPQNQPTKSGSIGSSDVFAGGSQTPLDSGSHTGDGTPGQPNSGPVFHTTPDPGTGGSTTQQPTPPTETTQVVLNSNAAPLVVADTDTTHLKEVGNIFQPGVSKSVANVTMTDIDGTVTYNTAALLAAGWILKSPGVYAKDGSYGTATLNTTTNVVTYRLDNNNPATDALGASDHPTEIFNIPVVDDKGATASTNVVFTVDGTNDAPQVEGGLIKFVSVDENASGPFTAIQATDPEGSALTYSIVTGLLSPDASKFVIDPVTGALSFRNAPDYENPTDFLHNNVYEVQVRVSDGTLTDIQTVVVTVNDVNEAPVVTAGTASITYTENGSAKKLMPSASISDPDSPSNFRGGSVDVALNGAVAGDELVLVTNSHVSISGGHVYVDGRDIGTLSGNHSDHLTIDFTSSNATDARIEQVMRAVSFQSTSDNPTDADRSAVVTFNDGGHDGAGGALSGSSTIAIHVTPVNDAPHGADQTVTADENASYIFKVADFGFSDVDGNALQAMKITSLPDSGALTNNGHAICVGDYVSAADISGGKLSFTPDENHSGADYASFSFKVQDDGGTANGGHNTESSSHTITIDVTPASQPESGTLAFNADSSWLGFFPSPAGHFSVNGISIVDDNPGASVTANATALHGTLSPNSGTGTLDYINGGVAFLGYQADGSAQTDTVTLAVTDANGHSGSINFVFATQSNANVTLAGAGGQDVIFASPTGSGSATMTGGAGADTFVFGGVTGENTITDFAVGQDSVNIFNSALITDFNSLLAHTTNDDHGNAVVSLGGPPGMTNTITFSGVDKDHLQSGDFHFGMLSV